MIAATKAEATQDIETKQLNELFGTWEGNDDILLFGLLLDQDNNRVPYYIHDYDEIEIVKDPLQSSHASSDEKEEEEIAKAEGEEENEEVEGRGIPVVGKKKSKEEAAGEEETETGGGGGLGGGEKKCARPRARKPSPHLRGPIVKKTKKVFSSIERDMLNLPILITRAANTGDMAQIAMLTDKFMIADVVIRTKGLSSI